MEHLWYSYKAVANDSGWTTSKSQKSSKLLLTNENRCGKMKFAADKTAWTLKIKQHWKKKPNPCNSKASVFEGDFFENKQDRLKFGFNA